MNNNMIVKIAETFKDKKSVTENEIKRALSKEKIDTPAMAAELMDELESRGIEIKTNGYVEDEEDESPDLSLVRLYFKDVSRKKLLSFEEEQRLLKRAKEGDKKAEETLVESNLRLVVSIAKRYTYKAEYLDLISSGNIGLLNAIRHFDASKGTKLSTYATWWIKQAISRMIADCGSTIRLPAYAVQIVGNLNAYISKFTEENGREPSISEIAENFTITDETAEAILKIKNGCASLDIPVASDESGLTTQGEMIADDKVCVEEDVMNKLMREDLVNVLSDVLTEKEADVMLLRYGMGDDGEQHTLEEIGVAYGVSRERIRQIEKKAFAKLRSSEAVYEKLYPWLMSA